LPMAPWLLLPPFAKPLPLPQLGVHWAVRAEASSTYADQRTGLTEAVLGGNRVILGGDNYVRKASDQRLDRLEKDVKELKDMLQKLVNKPESVKYWLPDADSELQRLQKENQDLQQRLKELEQKIKK